MPAPAKRQTEDNRTRLAEIIRTRSFGRGKIILASGRESDFYVNLKPTMLDAEGAALLAELTLEALRGERIDYVGGLEMGAVPLAGAMAQLSFMQGRPIQAFFVRKKPKEHGAKLSVEGLAPGESLKGKRVVVIEDVTTTGGSAIKAVDAVKDAGGEVVLVFTIVDREEGATETFRNAGVAFRSLFRAAEFLKN
jgi:orotate phosphoribosyltransferase